MGDPSWPDLIPPSPKLSRPDLTMSRISPPNIEWEVEVFGPKSRQIRANTTEDRAGRQPARQPLGQYFLFVLPESVCSGQRRALKSPGKKHLSEEWRSSEIRGQVGVERGIRLTRYGLNAYRKRRVGYDYDEQRGMYHYHMDQARTVSKPQIMKGAAVVNSREPQVLSASAAKSPFPFISTADSLVTSPLLSSCHLHLHLHLTIGISALSFRSTVKVQEMSQVGSTLASAVFEPVVDDEEVVSPYTPDAEMIDLAVVPVRSSF